MIKRIPKIIHYCWFGNNELSELNRKCIDSWKKFLPDYEIKEWNDSNYDFNVCNYVKEAFDSKKWAFVSDFARFDILYKYGGLYFDTDVELIKNIDDLIDRGPFFCLESGQFILNNYNKDILKSKIYDDVNRISLELKFSINPGLAMCSYAGNSLYRAIIDSYNDRNFINKEGHLDKLTVCDFVTEIMVKNGFENKDGIGYLDDITIYPKEYFNPKDSDSEILTITDNTRAIHHYEASWYSPIEKKIHKILSANIKKYGEKKGRKIAIVKALPYSIINKIQNKGVVWTIRFAVKKILGYEINNKK